MSIKRKNLRSQVRDELLARMRSGAISPGEGINEVQLAAELGVSRTPLREALIALESEGQIESEDGKGFRFMPLREREFEELAPIMATLEGLALALSPREVLRELGVRLSELAAEFDQELVEHSLVLAKDEEWHELMLSACPNTRLLALIKNLRGSVHRYESLLVPDDVMIERVSAEHAEIARNLIAGDIPGAAAALEINWTRGSQRILETARRANVRT